MFGPPQYEFHGYGATAVSDAPLKPAHGGFARGERRRLNVLPICLNVFLPWILFSTLFAVMSFSIHYHTPHLAYAACFVAGLVVFVVGALAVNTKRSGRGDPTWYIFACFTLCAAWLLAISFGDMNFVYNMQIFYDVQHLDAYPSVSPAILKGQQLMDAGRISFTPGTSLDFSKAMSFKNLDLYCVAPIVEGTKPLDSYDFWAVGLNCCTGTVTDFQCGEFNNPQARSGLRLMHDEQRAFFRLAVQQAESAYNIRATHPIFLHWVQDPVAELNSYREEGFRYFLAGVFAHFVFNLFCVICAVFGFSKLGY